MFRSVVPGEDFFFQEMLEFGQSVSGEASGVELGDGDVR